MQSLVVLSLLAASVAAQATTAQSCTTATRTTCPTTAPTQPDPYNPDPAAEVGSPLEPYDTINATVLPYIINLASISNATIKLDQNILALTSLDGVAPALAAAQGLLDAINAQAAAALAQGPLNIDDTTSDGINAIGPLLDYAGSLEYHVGHAAYDLITKKDIAVQFCEGPTVLQAIKDTTSAAISFVDNYIPQLPSDLQCLGVDTYIVPILDFLQSASCIYATETTTSPGCTPTGGSGSTTTTGSGTVATTTGTDASTTGAASSTTGAVYSTSGGASPTTGGVYPTSGGSSPTETTTAAVYQTTTSEEDCEETTTTGGAVYTTPGSVYTTGGQTTGGVVYTTSYYDDCVDDSTTAPGGVYTTGAQTTGGVVYTTSYYDDCVDDSTTAPGGVYTTGGGVSYTTSYYDDCVDDETTTGGSNPTAVYTTGGGKTTPAPVYTTGGSGVKPTTTGGIQTYAGGAVANNAGVGGVLAAALAALLL